MPVDRYKKKPLYRRVNTRTYGVRHGFGGKAKWERGTKEGPKTTMHGKKHHGLDYTPLFHFLLSKIGKDWTAVYQEAVARLDCEEPIFWMVARHAAEEKDYVRVGESSYFSGL